jgi:hypothetical protein
VGPWACNVPVGTITVSDLSKASFASSHDMSESLNFNVYLRAYLYWNHINKNAIIDNGSQAGTNLWRKESVFEDIPNCD